jgi:endonuclease/exonuclease/phosphatase family metal-dependent hydrolase
MQVRVATFNLENWKLSTSPTLEERIAVTRPQLLRLRPDILCLQEANGDTANGSRDLVALKALIADTPLADFQIATTVSSAGEPFEERNLVIMSRFPILQTRQFKHEFTPAPMYRKVTADPPEAGAKEVEWERPLLHAIIQVSASCTLHVLNVHLKSKIPTTIAGQKINNYTWRTISGYAEGFFLSSLKRVGQALEARVFIDQLFDADPRANIVIGGDFNADLGDVPVRTIRGEVEDTGNGTLSGRVMVPCENTVPESSRYSLFHQGRGEMIDHILFSRPMLPHYRTTEIHNEILHDESIAFATDLKFPESDHAPVVAEFDLP